ncbi:MAG: NADH-quinone oxidoreductase subunit NuoK [bacterium]
MVPLNWYLLLAFLMFTIGIMGVLLRRNVLIVLMSIELMLNSANLVFIVFSRYLLNVGGQVMVLLVIAVAAAEVAVGLGIVVALYRHIHSVDLEKVNLMKW